ncbi:MAG: ShlB/FhaC/HecB family hemolysin secretion/activation protein [Phycisphaerales bacterium]|nr:ShlB/FhaC/HecB family hemolysin secretion/activation protein [Phycisphaerales bacterium]
MSLNLISHCRVSRGLLIVLVVACSVLGTGAAAQPDQPETRQVVEASFERDGYGYRMTGLVFRYVFGHPDLPAAGLLDAVVVPLTPVDDGYIGVVAGEEIVLVRLGELGVDEAVVVYGSALATINQGVRDYLESEFGLIGHLVTPDADEVAYQSTREDLRGVEQTTLSVLIWRAVVGQVRTVAHGDRLAENKENKDSNIDHPSHQRLRDRIKVAPGDLLTRDRLDDEIHRLNRHPGRRADVTVAPTEKPGEVLLDYLITEPRPWTVFAQISNTGTDSTDVWRERFGYINRQLTGRDDIFQFDYITAGFDESHTLLASYEFDLGHRTRAKVFGRWNEYTARDVGLGFENFTGEGYEIGAEVQVNVYQDGPKFVDLVGGVRFEHIDVQNRLFLISGRESFLLPYAGVRYEKRTPVHNAFGELTVETNLASVAGTSSTGVQRLGRFGVDDDFTILRGQLSHSFFLEPILDPKGFRGDFGEGRMTLAHEVFVSIRGQYSFGGRLVPNYEFVAGGFHTVRGYPESSTVGDDALVGTLEYRYHLGKATRVGDAGAQSSTIFGRPFNSTRTRPYGGADWDVILRGFFDFGFINVNDAPFFENDETLASIGVGVEARLRRNLTVRLDYGLALTNIGEGAAQTTSVGDGRLHFSATIVY